MISFPAMQLGAVPIVVTIDLWHQDTACSILNLSILLSFELSPAYLLFHIEAELDALSQPSFEGITWELQIELEVDYWYLLRVPSPDTGIS